MSELDKRNTLERRINWPTLIRRARRSLAAKPHELARRLGVAPRTVKRWELGENEPRGAVRQALIELDCEVSQSKCERGGMAGFLSTLATVLTPLASIARATRTLVDVVAALRQWKWGHRRPDPPQEIHDLEKDTGTPRVFHVIRMRYRKASDQKVPTAKSSQAEVARYYDNWRVVAEYEVLLEDLFLTPKCSPLAAEWVTHWISIAYIKLGELSTARKYIEQLQRALSPVVRFEAQVNLGHVHRSEGELEEAAVAFKGAFAIDSNNSTPIFNLLCIASLERNAPACREWAQRLRVVDLSSQRWNSKRGKSLRTDPDLDFARKQGIIKEVFPPQRRVKAVKAHSVVLFLVMTVAVSAGLDIPLDTLAGLTETIGSG